jgi:hypothetical protein
MKRIKPTKKKRRSLSLSSDSDDSYASYCSNDSNKSYGRWCKRRGLGPILRTSPSSTVTQTQSDAEAVALARNKAPTIRIQPVKNPSSPDASIVTLASAPPSVRRSNQETAFFDLTGESREHSLLPGVSFEALKRRHELFFSYDPRGSKEADERYCPHCKCPRNYCNETVFGQVVKNQVLFFIEDIGGVTNEGVEGDSTFYNYQKIYSEEIHHKMLTNGIKVPSGYNFHKLIRIPECIFQGSLKELIQECEKVKYMRFELGSPWLTEEEKKNKKKT